jgi:hypothetical protein
VVVAIRGGSVSKRAWVGNTMNRRVRGTNVQEWRLLGMDCWLDGNGSFHTMMPFNISTSA